MSRGRFFPVSVCPSVPKEVFSVSECPSVPTEGFFSVRVSRRRDFSVSQCPEGGFRQCPSVQVSRMRVLSVSECPSVPAEGFFSVPVSRRRFSAVSECPSVPNEGFFSVRVSQCPEGGFLFWSEISIWDTGRGDVALGPDRRTLQSGVPDEGTQCSGYGRLGDRAGYVVQCIRLGRNRNRQGNAISYLSVLPLQKLITQFGAM